MQTLRIIGGEYRGRKLEFKLAEGLRPTSDRVRETLFNWLQPMIAGAKCLDMFAGSGLLGIEALSRGAAEVVFIEKNPDSIRQLQLHIDKLAIKNAQLISGDALTQLDQLDAAFDVVFIDPPFNKDLLIDACELLQEEQLIKSGSRVYLESERSLNVSELPSNWQLTRSKQAGQVYYYLVIIN